MASAIDLYVLEKKIGKDAAKKLRSSLRSAVKETTTSRSGTAAKTTNARAFFKDQSLQRLSIIAPSYIFKQHYGFEGSKKNGVKMRLKATDIINKALEDSNVLENLADELTNIRSEEVLAAINIFSNGR